MPCVIDTHITTNKIIVLYLCKSNYFLLRYETIPIEIIQELISHLALFL